MRQNRPYGSEGGESGSTGLPYPYRATVGYGEGPNRSHPLPSGGGAREAGFHRLATGGYGGEVATVCLHFAGVYLP
jgi:hypothetical protein